ncbi:MAG: hypothetical protein CMG62_05460 [Candidatus Marinimicrobia bacterium]|nr:hypothetical protein [Candidatus Neomarinimicrobiota bacterium]
MNIIIGIFLFMLAVMAMSIGIIFNREPLSGSCGGLNQKGVCTICGNNPEKCDNT